MKLALICGRSGAGKSSLIRALLKHDPMRIRCLTIVAAREKRNKDVVHPHNPAWGEYAYVTPALFATWEADAKFVHVGKGRDGTAYGLLHSMIEETKDFPGWVVVDLPMDLSRKAREFFSDPQITLALMYLDVNEEDLEARLTLRGHDADEIAQKISETEGWREQAMRQGFAMIGNVDGSHMDLEAVLDRMLKIMCSYDAQ